MGLLSNQEALVWSEFHKGKPTSSISEDLEEDWSPAYVSRILNRVRSKISKALREHANSHRLDVESLLDYKGLLIGFDYQANASVYMVYSDKLGIVVWYKHDSYDGKLCPDCPKESECKEVLETIMNDYKIALRKDEGESPMTQKSIVIFNKLAAKEIPRYKRKKIGGE